MTVAGVRQPELDGTRSPDQFTRIVWNAEARGGLTPSQRKRLHDLKAEYQRRFAR